MGDKLKTVLEQKGILQKDLADEVGVSEAFMSYIIKGHKQPSVALLKRMSEYLGVPMDDLV